MDNIQTRLFEASKALNKDEAEQLPKILRQMGIEDSDVGLTILDSDSTVFEDFLSTLKAKCNESLDISLTPITKLKFVWSVLKKAENKKQVTNITNINELKPIANWSDVELLEKYGKDCLTGIEEELLKRSHGRPCIIFQADGTVDVENSLYMLRRAHRQDTPKTYMIQNELKILYRVGDFPANVFYECPIHSDILLIDGYCEECANIWDTNDTKRNILLRLISEREKVDMRIYKTKTFDELKKEFSKTYLEYICLEEENKLPALKRRISKNKQGDPFRVVHTTY